jgi:hypothetical protein
MLTRRRPLLALVVLAVVAASAGVACDLNPQPLPPGFSSGAPGAGGDNGADAAASVPTNGGGGHDAGFSADAGGTPPVAGGDGGVSDAETGGDGGVASDAGGDATDAETGATDAETDGGGDAGEDASDAGEDAG